MRRFGLLVTVLTLSVVAWAFVSHPKVNAATSGWCEMLGDPTNDGTTPAACLPGQLPAITQNIGGGSSASIASQLINDVNTAASSPYPVNRVSAAYIKGQLQKRGGNWTSNLTLPGVTLSVEAIPSAYYCANHAFDPTANGGSGGIVNDSQDCHSDNAVIVRQNGVIVFILRTACGNVFGDLAGITPDTPPTGSFSISCNTIGTAAFRAGTLSDAQGTPSATLTVGGFSQSGIRSGNTITIPYNYVENATSVRFVIHNVGPEGSSLDVTQTGSVGPCNRPTTGGASATCTIGANAAGDKYNFTVSFGDGNQATKAQLVGNGYSRAITSQGSFSVTTTTIPRSAFPLQYQVADMDDNVLLRWDTKATINHTGSMNCPAKGTITPQTSGTCAVVNVTSWDANAPTAGNQFKLILGTGGSQTYTSNGGQDAGPTQENVSTISGFDGWRANTVTLQVYDADAGTWTSMGTAQLKICDTVSCKQISTMVGWVAGEQEAFQVYATITHNAENKAPIVGPPGAKFAVSITGPYSQSYPLHGYSPASGSLTLANSPNDLKFTPKDAGIYTLHWSITGGEATSPPSPAECRTEIHAGYEPFFTVGGGDFAAGAGFGSSCATNGSAGVTAYNLNNMGGSGYFGSGSQLGVLANGGITQFASDATNDPSRNLAISTNGVSSNIPSALAFPNNGGPSGGSYGGGLGHSSGWCVPDYVGNTTDNPSSLPTFNPSSLASGTYKLNGSTLNGFNFPASDASHPGLHITVVATGDVFIDDNINYGNYSVVNGDITQVPQFTLLITGGNLYIKNSVSHLSGFYDVQPSKTKGGTLYTCASGLNNPYINDYADCAANSLTIDGAVSAAQLKLDRTYGNLVSTPTQQDEPSELFDYSPELWLGNITGPNCKADPNAFGCLYQAYTALPPVL